jgi:hypothetical protein
MDEKTGRLLALASVPDVHRIRPIYLAWYHAFNHELCRHTGSPGFIISVVNLEVNATSLDIVVWAGLAVTPGGQGATYSGYGQGADNDHTQKHALHFLV